MDDMGGNFADETNEMTPESAANASAELRKRRSTRIVQAVPLVVTGVDALGRPFVERTSTLIINCHGCRYQSKHYVLKNMWVTLEIPHPEAGQPPRTIRGRVAWIQRPRTVRQLFQVALEVEIPGNVWGIAFPPEDWSTFPCVDAPRPEERVTQMEENATSSDTTEIHLPLTDSNLPPAIGTDNVRIFPSPASTTDASLQLARQVTRLLSDAKQQINATAKEAVAQAASSEQRSAFEQWEQKFAAARAEVTNEASRAIEKIQHEAEGYARSALAAAAKALQSELPVWLAPQLQQLTHDLTAKLSQEGVAQRAEHTQQLTTTVETLRELCQRAEETAARLKTQAEETESRVAAREKALAENAEQSTRQREESVVAQQQSLNSMAAAIQQQVADALASSQSSWHAHLSHEIETAQSRWQTVMEGTFAAAQERAASGLIEHGRALSGQLQEEIARHAYSLKENVAANSSEAEQKIATLRDASQQEAQRIEEMQRNTAQNLNEQSQAILAQWQNEMHQQLSQLQENASRTIQETEQRLKTLHDGLHEQSQHLNAALQHAGESVERLDNFSARIENVQQQALGGFQSQLDDILSLHRNELHRRSEALFEEINGRVRASFDELSQLASTRFHEQITAMVQPHVTSAEEAVHRLAGGRSLLDAALALQQDRIRSSADEAFAESLCRFRENLGGTEQLLQDSAQAVTAQSLNELETKIGDLRHQTVEDLMKSGEWYEKKAQTQIQHATEKAIELASNHLREKAGEISSMFASELDHSSRNFVGHTHRQMDEVVREAFERSQALFAEAAETTAAAYTDEIQRTARQELESFAQELQGSVGEVRTQMDAARTDLSQRVTAEQEDFLRRFRESMNTAMESGVADVYQRVQGGLAPLLESWKSMTETHQTEMRNVYTQISEQAAQNHSAKLENVSNQWMLATVAAFDHQSREVVSGIAATAEEQLRAACAQLFANIGDTLRERLNEIATTFTKATESTARAKSATSGT